MEPAQFKKIEIVEYAMRDSVLSIRSLFLCYNRHEMSNLVDKSGAVLKRSLGRDCIASSGFDE